MPQEIQRIVLTGGPCAGKTTALAIIEKWLASHGYKVFKIPEVATLLFSNGVSLHSLNEDERLEIQLTMADTFLALEKSFLQACQIMNHPKNVIISDRGMMDAKAYLSSELWQRFLFRMDVREKEIRDLRYEAVFHLVTAANGAEQYYTLANNSSRTETVEEARALDERTRLAWCKHQKHYIIENDEHGFSSKMEKLTQALTNWLL